MKVTDLSVPKNFKPIDVQHFAHSIVRLKKMVDVARRAVDPAVLDQPPPELGLPFVVLMNKVQLSSEKACRGVKPGAFGVVEYVATSRIKK